LHCHSRHFRHRTLPVSVLGVIAACFHSFSPLFFLLLRKEIPPAQQTHTHEATLALISLFHEGESVDADFQEGDFLEGGSDPFVDIINNELEFLELGGDYINDIDGIVDVTDGIAAAADGEALSPIRNLGEQLVMLENLFDDFEGNINWEEDDDEDDLIPPVTNSLMDTAWQMKKKHTEGSYHDLLTLPCSIGHPPHSSASPVELHLRVGPHVLSGKKRSEGERGVEICLSGMLHKGISLG
jgi:hypothetical protein